jgi:hypothetical protein
LSLADWIKLVMAAARWPAANVPANGQFLRSWKDEHDRKAWLFVGRELAGQRAAMGMSLAHSAKLHGHDPWRYLKDVLERLPTLRTAASTNCCRIDGKPVLPRKPALRL